MIVLCHGAVLTVSASVPLLCSRVGPVIRYEMSPGWVEEANGALSVVQLQLFTFEGFSTSKMLVPAGHDCNGDYDDDGAPEATAINTGLSSLLASGWEQMAKVHYVKLKIENIQIEMRKQGSN